MSGRLFHASTIVVAVPAERAFAYLSDGLKQSDWALGSWEREQIGDQLFRGTSLFDGSETFVRISADETWLLVDYAVGPTLERMPRVNSARIIPRAVARIPRRQLRGNAHEVADGGAER